LEDSSEQDEVQLALPGLLARPPHQLSSLSVQLRWEVSRRHPYYSCWWRPAAAHHDSELSLDSVEYAYTRIATYVLGEIGIAGAPPDPRTEFDSLDKESIQTAWLSGEVQPLSLRALATLMIASAPKPLLQYLATVFYQASCDDKPERQPTRAQAIEDLSRSEMSNLNTFLAEPYVAVRPGASIKQAQKALGALMRVWKKERNLGDQRVRSDKHQQYLQVWDLREGWRSGAYIRANELKLIEIAKKLKRSTSTVSNQYRSAFELITGHPYTPATWYLMMGPIKLTELSAELIGGVSQKRPLKSPSRRPIPDSVLTPSPTGERRSQGISESARAHGVSVAFELIENIEAMIDSGDTNAQILKSLGYSDVALPAIEEIRARHSEGI
jgi:hypothetical protein